MSNELERIGMRRIELRKEYSHEYGLSFEEFLLSELIKAEDRVKKLEKTLLSLGEKIVELAILSASQPDATVGDLIAFGDAAKELKEALESSEDKQS